MSDLDVQRLTIRANGPVTCQRGGVPRVNPLYREGWRSLPLQEVLRPTLDGPVLAFPESRQLTAVKLLEQILSEHVSYRRAFKPEHRKAHGIRMRKLHLARVSIAIGVKLPGHPHVVHEFVA